MFLKLMSTLSNVVFGLSKLEVSRIQKYSYFGAGCTLTKENFHGMIREKIVEERPTKTTVIPVRMCTCLRNNIRDFII